MENTELAKKAITACKDNSALIPGYYYSYSGSSENVPYLYGGMDNNGRHNFFNLKEFASTGLFYALCESDVLEFVTKNKVRNHILIENT
jgi:hypothetical protein